MILSLPWTKPPVLLDHERIAFDGQTIRYLQANGFWHFGDAHYPLDPKAFSQALGYLGCLPVRSDVLTDLNTRTSPKALARIDAVKSLALWHFYKTESAAFSTSLLVAFKRQGPLMLHTLSKTQVLAPSAEDLLQGAFFVQDGWRFSDNWLCEGLGRSVSLHQRAQWHQHVLSVFPQHHALLLSPCSEGASKPSKQGL